MARRKEPLGRSDRRTIVGSASNLPDASAYREFFDVDRALRKRELIQKKAEAFLSRTILRVVERTLKSDGATKDDKVLLIIQGQHFEASFDILTKDRGVADSFRPVICAAIKAAFVIGAFGETPESVKRVFSREQTRSAIDRTRAMGDLIQRAIDSEARLLWSKRPIFSSSDNRTASEIWEKVRDKISELPEERVPRSWRTKSDRERWIDRIRKRLGKTAH
jgi:hypothetical protein